MTASPCGNVARPLQNGSRIGSKGLKVGQIEFLTCLISYNICDEQMTKERVSGMSDLPGQFRTDFCDTSCGVETIRRAMVWRGNIREHGVGCTEVLSSGGCVYTKLAALVTNVTRGFLGQGLFSEAAAQGSNQRNLPHAVGLRLCSCRMF